MRNIFAAFAAAMVMTVATPVEAAVWVETGYNSLEPSNVLLGNDTEGYNASFFGQFTALGTNIDSLGAYVSHRVFPPDGSAFTETGTTLTFSIFANQSVGGSDRPDLGSLLGSATVFLDPPHVGSTDHSVTTSFVYSSGLSFAVASGEEYWLGLSSNHNASTFPTFDVLSTPVGPLDSTRAYGVYNTFSNYFVTSGYGNFAFKVTGNSSNSLPDPATWMTMIVGFALIGAAMRAAGGKPPRPYSLAVRR